MMTSTATPLSPNLTSLNLPHGLEAGGYAVTLTGLNFTNNAAVSFGVEGAFVVRITSTQIVVMAPAGIGTVLVGITQGNEVSNLLSFSYDNPINTPTPTTTFTVTPTASITTTPTVSPTQTITIEMILSLSVNQLNNLSDPPLVIKYRSSGTLIDLRIYNPTANSIRHLCSCVLQPGFHTFVWDGKDDNGEPVNTGLYLVMARESGHVELKKVLVVKR